MKRVILVLSGLVLVALIAIIGLNITNNKTSTPPQDSNLSDSQNIADGNTSLLNPASVNCTDQGGSLEIVTQNDGGQFGLCNFSDYSCEEWALYRGECDLEKDSQAIFQALSAKGLNLTGMKVVIKKHLGKYISGSVTPISEPAGGGYVFAVKSPEGMQIVADGNGMITCQSLKAFSDFPSYLIPSCVDSSGNLQSR